MVKGHKAAELRHDGIGILHVPPGFVFGQNSRNLNAGDGFDQHNIEQAVIHGCIGRSLITAAVIAAITDGRHHISTGILFAIDRNAQLVAEAAEHSL